MYIREDLAGSSLEALLKSMEDYEGQAVFNSSYNYTPNKLLGYFFQMSDDFYGMVNWEEKIAISAGSCGNGYFRW